MVQFLSATEDAKTRRAVMRQGSYAPSASGELRASPGSCSPNKAQQIRASTPAAEAARRIRPSSWRRYSLRKAASNSTRR